MPYITSIQRVEYRLGLRRGIESLLRARFGEEGLRLMPAINNIHEADHLERILTALETAPNVDAISQQLTQPES